MLGSLTSEQCRHLLASNYVGRVGFVLSKKPFILPITYVFDGKAIYCRSYEGTKINAMRKSSSVCFQLDHIESLTRWYSVLAWGRYEELKAPADQKYVERLFSEHLMVHQLGETVSLSREFDQRPHVVEKRKKPVTWKIKIQELTGRFEKP